MVFTDVNNYVFPGSLDFIGPVEVDDLPMFYDFFKEYSYAEDSDDYLIVNGKRCPYFLTDPHIYPDDKGNRVLVDGNYYYFG